MSHIRTIALTGEEVLNGRAQEVTDPLAPAIRALVEDMMVTMDDAGGIGIAAPQVHEAVRVILVASTATEEYPNEPDMDPTVMINPEILSVSGEMVEGWEGCLSIPGIRGLVPRDRKLQIRYTTTEGEIVERRLLDFAARVFQHELDHLDGILFPQRAIRIQEADSSQ